MKKVLFLRYICILAIVTVCAVIYFMSAKPAEVSSEISGSVISCFIKAFKNNFTDLSLAEQNEIISEYQFFARKLAHFSVYATLGFFCFGFSLTFKNLNKKLKYIISVAFAFVYAATDEFHQLFVNGRSGQITDVLLDTFGAAFGVLLLSFILFCLGEIKHNEAERKKQK